MDFQIYWPARIRVRIAFTTLKELLTDLTQFASESIYQSALVDIWRELRTNRSLQKFFSLNFHDELSTTALLVY